MRMHIVMGPILVVLALTCAACLPSARRGAPSGAAAVLVSEGLASYYADAFEGRRTASGDMFSQGEHTAAHRSFPFGTLLRVTNLKNGRATEVRVNDRGPTKVDRLIDLSRSAATDIDMINDGIVRVRVEVVEWGDGGG